MQTTTPIAFDAFNKLQDNAAAERIRAARARLGKRASAYAIAKVASAELSRMKN